MRSTPNHFKLKMEKDLALLATLLGESDLFLRLSRERQERRHVVIYLICFGHSTKYQVFTPTSSTLILKNCNSNLQLSRCSTCNTPRCFIRGTHLNSELDAIGSTDHQSASKRVDLFCINTCPTSSLTQSTKHVWPSPPEEDIIHGYISLTLLRCHRILLQDLSEKDQQM